MSKPRKLNQILIIHENFLPYGVKILNTTGDVPRLRAFTIVLACAVLISSVCSWR